MEKGRGEEGCLYWASPLPLPPPKTLWQAGSPLPTRASRREGEDQVLHRDCLIQWQWGSAPDFPKCCHEVRARQERPSQKS